MDKTLARVIADSAVTKRASGLAERMNANVGDGDVNGFALHVETVLGHVPSFPPEQTVVFWRPETGNNVYLIVSTEVFVNPVQVLDHSEIHVECLLGVVAAQNPVEGLDCFLIVFAEGITVRDCQSFAIMGVVEGEFPFREVLVVFDLCEGRSSWQQYRCAEKRSFQKFPSAP